MEEITDKKQPDQKSRASELYYLIDNLDVGFFQVTLDGQMINHNRAHNVILGYEPSKNLIDKHVLDFWQNPNDRENYINILLKNDAVKNYRVHALTKDGKKIVVELNSRLIRDEHGEPFRIDGTFIDITEKSNLERKLKESEEKLRSLFYSFPHFIGLMDMKGRLVDCNPAINKFLSRHKREDLIGMNFMSILSIIDKNKELVPKLKKLFSEAVSEGNLKSFEFKMHRSAGDYLYLRIEGSLILINNQKFIQFIIQDITSRKITEEELKKSEDQLRERVNELSFLYKLSKLIESPIINEEGIIQGTLELIPSAFQFPEITSCRISYKNKIYTTINFEESTWKIATNEMIHEYNLMIEVYYFEDRPFLKEENDLIREIGIRLKTSLDQREAQRRLNESEERYRLISQNADENLFIFDMNLDLIYHDPNVPNILGYTNNEISNLKLTDYNEPSSLKTMLKAYKEELRNERKKLKDPSRIRSFEIDQIHKNGSIVNVEVKFTFLRDDKGIAKGIISMTRDISKRKQAEQKLRESEEKYRLISETAYDLIGVLNNKFKYEYINEGALQQLLGYKKDEILGESALKFIHPDDLELATKYLSIGFKKGYGEAEVRLKHKNGSWVWFEVRGKTFLDKDGEQKALLIFRDFTERKEVMEKLRESEERYRLISQNADENLFIFDMNLDLIYNDTSVPNILGYSYEEMRMMKITEYNTLDSLRITMKAYKEEIRNERKKLKDPLRIRTFEVEQIHKNGSIVNVETRFTFLRDKDGKAKGILGLSRDITKRKQAEQKLKESEEKYHDAYERANFYKDLFAHDINNILQIITSSAELISIQLGDSEKSKILGNLTKIINQQVERGGKLVKNVHTLSKLEEENIIVQPINLNDTLKNSIEFVNSSYEERNLKIQVNSTEIDFVVHANILLQDVFENILINGVKYNENSVVEILVKLTKIQRDNKNCIKMEFIDNGIGVSDKRKEIIFKKGNRKLKGDKGMGLGLSLVSKILTNFDGKIWVEDKVHGDYSKGSNFIIILPIKS